MRRIGELGRKPVLAAVLAGVILAAGACGTAREPASAGPVTAAQPPVPGPPAGSLRLADETARSLLASMVFPPGARALGGGPVPAQLRRPAEVTGSGHLVLRHQIRVVSRPAAWVLRFLRRHVPAGLTGSGTGYSGLAARPVNFLTWTRKTPGRGLYSAVLVVGVLAGRHGLTHVRADAQVIWYPPRSRAEYIRPVRYSLVTVLVRLLNPRLRVYRRTFASRTVIARLASTLNNLHANPGLTLFCPLIASSVRLTFRPRGTGPAVIAAAPSGCDSVAMSASGVPQPALLGGSATIELASRLLGVRLLPPGQAKPGIRH